MRKQFIDHLRNNTLSALVGNRIYPINRHPRDADQAYIIYMAAGPNVYRTSTGISLASGTASHVWTEFDLEIYTVNYGDGDAITEALIKLESFTGDMGTDNPVHVDSFRVQEYTNEDVDLPPILGESLVDRFLRTFSCTIHHAGPVPTG